MVMADSGSMSASMFTLDQVRWAICEIERIRADLAREKDNHQTDLRICQRMVDERKARADKAEAALRQIAQPESLVWSPNMATHVARECLAELEADEDIRQGRTRWFADIEAAIEWLDSAEEEKE